MRRIARLPWIATIVALCLLLAALLLRDRSRPIPVEPAELAGQAEPANESSAPAEVERSAFDEPVAPSEVTPSAERLRVLVLDATNPVPVAGAQVTLVDFDGFTRALEAAGTTIDTPAGRELRSRFENRAICGASGEADLELRGAHWGIEARSDETSLSRGRPWSKPRFDANGDARVRWIGLGLGVRADLMRGDTVLASTTVAGPTRDGELVECTLVGSPDVLPPRRFVTGRFVFTDGRAWPGSAVQARAVIFPAPEPYPEPQALACGDDGRFQLEVRHSLPRGGTRSYRISAAHPDHHEQFVVAFVPLSVEVPEGGLELGDVVLDHGSLLASGRVIDDLERPVKRARLFASTLVELDGAPYWPRVEISGTEQTPDDGTFELFLSQGEREPGNRMRLAVDAAGLVQAQPLEFTRGSTGLEVVVQRCGSLAGSLDLRDDLMVADVRVLLLSEGRVHGLEVRTDCAFASEPLLPGLYTLEVRVRGAGGDFETPPAARIDGLVVAPGESCRDSRIQRIRVGSSLALLAISVVDRFSAPIAGASARVADSNGARSFLAGADGVCRVRVERLPVDVTVSAFGFREFLLAGIAEDARVVLDAGLAVRLRVRRPSSASSAHQLFATLHASDASGASHGLVYPDTFPHERRALDEHGELRLRLPASGTYRCDLNVLLLRADHIGSGAQIALDPLATFTVAERDQEQVFEFDLPSAALEAALARAQR